ncbi:MAG: DUF4157 domain-containing protein [Blastocatellia bacterium]
MSESRLAPPSPQGAATPQAGAPLPAALRHQMETNMGANFSDVRVHVGHQAVHLNAQAYTNGQDIHFAPGAYDPGSNAGQQLIAHELTHVVQQRAVGPKTVPPGMVEVEAAPAQ